MKAALLLALVLVLRAVPAAAGEFSDLLFAPGTLASSAGGGLRLVYDHDMDAPDAEDGAQIRRDTLILSAAPLDIAPPRLLLSKVEERAAEAQPVSDFSSASAHPVVMYFLESVVRHMAEATGGSPFYLRNRLREALASAPLVPLAEADGPNGPVALHRVTLRPFEGDANREKMGPFGDLELGFDLAPGLPGGVMRLWADTTGSGGLYKETIALREGDGP